MRTAGGAGLGTFIKNNINLFEKEVAEVILNLVKEVCPDDSTNEQSMEII